MPLTIDNTLAGELSNSYCDLDFANTYWDGHYSATKANQWAALSDPQKTSVLIDACRILEGIRFTLKVGLPQYATFYDRRSGKVLDMNLRRDPVRWYYYQRLQFPRNLDIYMTEAPTGSKVGDLFMLEEPQMAQCEQAVYLLSFDESILANRLQGVTMDTLGLGRQQITTTQEYSGTGNMFSPMAIELLRPLMIKGGKLQRS